MNDEDIREFQELINTNKRSQSMITKNSISTLGAIGSAGTSGSNHSRRAAANYYKEINKIRNKLDDFLGGTNPLVKVMSPQTIREMVKEMRHDIRGLKRESGLTELDIIRWLEKELEKDEERKYSRYEYDEVPF